jgi:hypothetical protein
MVRRINPFSSIFKPPPVQWGLRGDPFLWRAMARALSSSTFPKTEVQLIALIETTFERLTGSLALYHALGTSRILEGLMARWGFGEGRMGNGLWMFDAEKN